MPDIDTSKFSPALVQLAISSGTCDDYLEPLSRWVQARKEVLATQLVASLNVGDTVYISTTVRPKLLSGVRCIVVSLEVGGKVKVRIDQHTGSAKWSKDSMVTLPSGLVSV